MSRIKLFEDFMKNNIEGSIIKQDDIIKCIKLNGNLYADIINNFPDNDVNKPLKPISIDEFDTITILYDSTEHDVELKNVIRIEY